MDPDENLALLRQMANRAPDSREEAEQFAELFAALDAWLCSGGFLPGDWTSL